MARESLAEFCLRTGEERLLRQWSDCGNGDLSPETVSYGSKKHVWWQCEKGHRWQAMVYTRTAGSECPYCTGTKALAGFNDLETLCPDVAAQWHPFLNGDLTPRAVTAGSKRQVWWQCGEGHIWKAIIFSRTGTVRRGCPICAGRVRQARVPAYSSSVVPLFSAPEK